MLKENKFFLPLLITGLCILVFALGWILKSESILVSIIAIGVIGFSTFFASFKLLSFSNKKIDNKTPEISDSSYLENNSSEEIFRREFIGNVSHELKTPLFSIQGYLLTLIEGAIEDLSIRGRYLNRINKSVERLIHIVKDLDLITQLESNELRLSMEPFNLISVCKDVIDLLEIEANLKNCILQFDKEYISSIQVVGDCRKIEQVIYNLVSNAIYHSNRESLVQIQIESVKNQYKITVSDTGNGISKEHLEKLFVRFYRVNKSRSRQEGEGSGLGLSIVKLILKAHKKDIFVTSRVGYGTKFYFFLDKA